LETCRWCKVKEIELNFGDDINNRLTEQGTCFSCDYYLQKANLIIAGQRYIKVASNLYYIGHEGPREWFEQLGFGGALWWIHLLNTEIYLTSTNLWHNSEGPAWFQEWMPDNAEFLKQEKTFPGMWDCECKENFRHHKKQSVCFECNTPAMNQPDSMWEEVTEEEKKKLQDMAFAHLRSVKRTLPIAI
jgi:hypothetical protein